MNKRPDPGDEGSWSDAVPTSAEGLAVYDCGCYVACPLHKSAPALLATLKDALPFLEAFYGWRANDVLYLARAAIEKAEMRKPAIP